MSGAAPPPATGVERPGFLADVGIVLAALRTRHPVACAAGICAVLWLAVELGALDALFSRNGTRSSVQAITGLTALVVGVTLALRLAWCPRAGLRGTGAWVAFGAVAAGLLVLARVVGQFPALWWDVGPSVSGALVLLAAASCARAARDRVPASAAEAAENRLVAAMQTHAWPVAVICAVCPEPATDALRLVCNDPMPMPLLPQPAPAPIHAGGVPLAFAAATMSGRSPSAALFVLAGAVAVARLAMLSTLVVSRTGIDLRAVGWHAPLVAAEFGVSLAVAAVATACRSVPRSSRRCAVPAVVAVLAACALGGLGRVWRARYGVFHMEPGLNPYLPVGREIAESALHQAASVLVVVLALFGAAASTLRPRTIIAAGAVAGVVATCVVRAIAGEEPRLGPETVTSAMQGIALAGWALLIRWARNATAVPQHHPLVRDWGDATGR